MIFVKILIATTLMGCLYHLLLSRQKTFLFNRIYLLTALVLPMLLPLISIPIHPNAQSAPLNNEYVMAIAETQFYLEDTAASTVVAALPETKTTGIEVWLIWIFVCLTSFFLIRFCYRLFALIRLMRSAQHLPYAGVRIALVEQPISSFSFWQTIFVHKAVYEAGQINEAVLQHELAHCKQWHSLDILFTELVLVFTWWNPINWILRSAIRTNHEFLADASVVNSQENSKSAYLELLLQSVLIQQSFALRSDFHQSCLKKRFIMIQKTSTRRTIAYSRIALLFLAVVVISLCSFSYSNEMPKVLQSSNSDTVPVINIPVHPYRPSGFDSAFILKSFSSTKEGVSQQEMDTYIRIAEKYNTVRLEKKSKLMDITDADKAVLKDIFCRMRPDQQVKVPIKFIKPFKPFGKNVPSENLYEQFKNPKVYGVWIDDKKVSNETLLKYKHSDFSHYFISKLYGGAKKGKPYTHQLNMMTNAGYTKYLAEAKANANEPIMVFSWRSSLVK